MQHYLFFIGNRRKTKDAAERRKNNYKKTRSNLFLTISNIFVEKEKKRAA
jgi:hypothetical protein